MTAPLTLFKALADASRLRLLRVLELSAFSVGELCRILDMGQSRVSRHLRILQDAALLRSRRQGTWVYYSLPRGPGDEGLATELLRVLAIQPSDHPEDRTRALETLELRSQRTSRFFDRVAPRWAEMRRQHLPDGAYLRELHHEMDACPVLADLGSGAGDLALELAATHQRVIGVDRSASMLAEAERRRSRAHLENVEFRLGTLEHLPLRDAEAGGAIMNMVLHYVADPPAVLREIHRALAPGGRLCIADLEAHPHEWMREQLNHQWLGFEPDELSSWLHQAGFEDVHTRTHQGPGEGPTVLLASGRRR